MKLVNLILHVPVCVFFFLFCCEGGITGPRITILGRGLKSRAKLGNKWIRL